MTLPPAIPIVFLCLGALAVGASHLARLRAPSLIMALTTLAALLATLTLGANLPATQIVADWQPVSVFTVPISFRVDQAAWVLSIGLLLICLATALTWLAHPGQHRPGPRAVSLLLVAAAIASLYASNLLTLVIAWGMMDIMLVVALLVRSEPQLGRRAATAIILYTSSTLSVWIATLLIENEHGSIYWRLLDPGHGAQLWLMLAAALRIGLYPLHQWLPTELGQSPDRATLLVAVPPATGLALLARLALTQALPQDSVAPALAAISALIGGVLAFRRPQRRAGLPFIALALASLSAVAVVGNSGGALIATALNWMFVIVSLFIARGFTRQQPWWSAGALIAAVSVAGLPGTLGFAGRVSLTGSLIAGNHWTLLIVVLAAETLLIAAIARPLFRPSAEEEPIGRARTASFAAAMACAALPIVIFALAPAVIPGLPSLSQLFGQLNVTLILALLLPVTAGVTLGWRFRFAGITTSDDTPEAVWERVVRLEWLNALVSALMHRLTALLRGLSNVIEGEGGLVWAIVIIVVGLVLTTGALR